MRRVVSSLHRANGVRPAAARTLALRPGGVAVLQQHVSPFSSTSGKTRKPQPPPLPEPSFVDVDGKCKIEYIDVQPEHASPSTPTLVMLHGAPGTYQDFRHIIPLLRDRGVRILGVNLPGFGNSTVLDRDNYYEHVSAMPSMRLTYSAVQRVLGHEHDNVFVLGHSFGGHAAVHFTGINAEQQQLKLKGLALLASAGYRPHKALQPRTNELVWRMLRSNVGVVERFAQWLTKQVYTRLLKFPAKGPNEYFAAGIVRCATADFDRFAAQIEMNKQLPAFVAWARDDAFIEEDIFLAVGEQCHPGPRLAFERGGHNIQKTKAALLADEMHRWIADVVEGKVAAASSSQIQVHP